jgi:hypothetical protein
VWACLYSAERSGVLSRQLAGLVVHGLVCGGSAMQAEGQSVTAWGC